jgi:hypothetical protein
MVARWVPGKSERMRAGDENRVSLLSISISADVGLKVARILPVREMVNGDN